MKVIPLTSKEERLMPVSGGLDLHNLEEFEMEIEGAAALDFLEELGLDQLEEE